MNLRNSIFLLAIAAAISAILFFQQEDTAPTITSSPPAIDKPVVKSSTENIPKIHNASVDWEEVRARMVNLDPSDKLTDEEIELYNSLHLLPFNPVTQIDCPSDDVAQERLIEQLQKIEEHQLNNPDDVLALNYKPPCEFIREVPEHQYSNFTYEELYELAYNDPIAALFIGIRYKRDTSLDPETEALRDEEDRKRTEWFIRAAALGEKSGPFIVLAETRYAAPIDEDEFVHRIALEMSAQYMKDPRALPDVWQQKFKNHLAGSEVVSSNGETMKEFCGESCGVFLEGEDLELEYLRGVGIAAQLSEDYLNYAVSIQREVKGSTTMFDLQDGEEGS